MYYVSLCVCMCVCVCWDNTSIILAFVIFPFPKQFSVFVLQFLFHFCIKISSSENKEGRDLLASCRKRMILY